MESFQGHTQTISCSQAQNPSEPPLFSPFIAKTLEPEGGAYSHFGSACYNQEHNLIIACPADKTIQCYDATTFEPQKDKRILKLRGSVVEMSILSGTDTYLLGCSPGFIYEYNVSKNKFKMLKKFGKKVKVTGITVLNSNFYAFLLEEVKEFYVGTLENDDGQVWTFDLKFKVSCSLHFLNKRNLLFSGLRNGDVRGYRTNNLPDLKVICTAQTGKYITAIQSMKISGKEYIVTASVDLIVRIWSWTKGRMRLIKVIYNELMPYSMVYLENYKMLVIAYDADFIKFFRLPSLKEERTVSLNEGGSHSLFLVKEKNSIGVASHCAGLIQFIKLNQ